MDDPNATTSPQQRYAPPSAEVADVLAAGEVRLAGRGVRFAAVVIDVIVLFAVFWLVSKLTPWNIFDPDPDPALGKRLLLALGSMLVFLLVQAWPLLTRAQTVGKVALGLRIVRPDGSRASPGRVLGLRYLAPYVLAPFTIVAAIYGVIDALMIFKADRRCLHDLIADTVVVKN
jgi:uncharacterized RDD family membrane protein YckC